MNKLLILSLTVTLVAGLAGCASPDTKTPTSNTTTTSTMPVTTTPANNDTDHGMPPMMDCTGDYVDENATGERIGLPELSFTVKEPDAADPCYAFVGPAQATAGWTVFSLENPANEFHIMPMYFIGNHTMEDVMGAFATGAEPDWAIPSGAVGGVTPHSNGSVVVDLKVGSYMYFCPIGGHMFKGMMGMLNVTAANETREAPEADATITLVDYNFTLPANLTANVSVIKVVNAGTEPHEAPLARLNANTTMIQFLEAVESETPTGPPPGALIGGVNAIAPGHTVYLLVDLEQGATYGLACFVESKAHDGAGHLDLGMVTQFTVA